MSLLYEFSASAPAAQQCCPPNQGPALILSTTCWPPYNGGVEDTFDATRRHVLRSTEHADYLYTIGTICLTLWWHRCHTAAEPRRNQARMPLSITTRPGAPGLTLAAEPDEDQKRGGSHSFAVTTGEPHVGYGNPIA